MGNRWSLFVILFAYLVGHSARDGYGGMYRTPRMVSSGSSIRVVPSFQAVLLLDNGKFHRLLGSEADGPTPTGAFYG
jgi:hypothetical protein